MPPRPPDEEIASCPESVQLYIRGLERVIEQLIKRQDEQEQKLREVQRQATPFRRKKKKPKKKHKKPGRKGGHAREARPEVNEYDEEHEADIDEACPCCGGAVEEKYVYEQTQEDIEVRRVVRKITVHVGQCTDCGEEVHGHHPWQTSRANGAAGHQIGPTALGLAAQLHYDQGVPFEKVAEILAQLGLKVSKAGLVRAMHRIGERAKETFHELLREVLRQDILHIDETGWSINGEPHYLWVISGGDVTVYFVRKTRSSDEVADFLQDFRGVLVTDGHTAYDKLCKKLARALCLLHLKRNMTRLEDRMVGRGKVLARKLHHWLDDTLKLVGKRSQLNARDFARRAAKLERRFMKLLDTRPTNAANYNMVQRLTEWQDAVMRCLRDRRVPATNNHGERQIRPAVVLRKRGGCNRSEKGARTFECLTSIGVSLRQQGRGLADWVTDLLRQPEPFAPAPFW